MNDKSKINRCKASNEISLARKAAWGIGGAADNLMMHGVHSLLFPIYNIGFGLDSVLVGLAQTIPRVIDVILDPIVGHLSDSTQSKWGKRRPYILIGALGCAAMFAALWMPPIVSEQWILFLYLLLVSLIYYAFYSVFVVPYTALGFEQTDCKSKRISFLAWRMYFGLAAGIAVPWLYKLTLLPVFGGSERRGAMYVGIGVGLLIALMGIAPALFSYDQVVRKPRQKNKLLEAIVITFRDKKFLLLLLVSLTIKTAWFVAYSLTIYINMYHVCEADKSFAAYMNGVNGTVIALLGYVGLPLAVRLSQALGKLFTLRLYLIAAMLAGLSSWWTFTSSYPYLQIATCIPLGIVLNGIWLLLTALVGDACTSDADSISPKREGIYSGVLMTTDKIMFGVVSLALGAILALVCFDPLEVPTKEIVEKLRIAFVAVQVLGMGLALILSLALTPRHLRAAIKS